MGEPASPMAAFVSLLVSRGLGGTELAEVIELAEAAFGGTTRSGVVDEARRERERLKKQRQRARRKAGVPGDVPGTTENRSYTISNNKTGTSEEVSKSDTKVSPGTKGDKPKRDRGAVLPPDWRPNEAHYAKGIQLGFNRAQVDHFAERMRNWAGANAHRQVARKSNWDLAFHNWLSDKADRNGGPPNGKTQDAIDPSKLGFAGLAAYARRSAVPDERSAPEDLEPLNRR